MVIVQIPVIFLSVHFNKYRRKGTIHSCNCIFFLIFFMSKFGRELYEKGCIISFCGVGEFTYNKICYARNAKINFHF